MLPLRSALAPLTQPRGVAAGGGASSLLTGLIAYWKLDEASGQRNDSAGANHLTDNNTVTQAAGRVGNAAQLTAANGEALTAVDNAALSLGADTPFTIVAWCWPDAITGAMDVVSKWGGAGNSTDIEYRLCLATSAGTPYSHFNFSNGLAHVSVDSFPNPVITVGGWNLLVAWHDPSADTINLQVNNGAVYSAAWAGGTQDGNGTLALGRTGTFGSLFFDGRLDEVGFWKRTLTAGERTQLYNAGNGVTYPAFS